MGISSADRPLEVVPECLFSGREIHVEEELQGTGDGGNALEVCEQDEAGSCIAAAINPLEGSQPHLRGDEGIVF